METLKARLQALEDLNKPSVDILLRKINTLAVKNGSDFDKYKALQLEQELVTCASNANHKKSSYYSVVLQEIRQRLHKPREQFKAYFLALFSDYDYGKVLQSMAKVDKCLRNPRSSVRNTPSIPPTLLVLGASRLVILPTDEGFTITLGETPHLLCRVLGFPLLSLGR